MNSGFGFGFVIGSILLIAIAGFTVWNLYRLAMGLYVRLMVTKDLTPLQFCLYVGTILLLIALLAFGWKEFGDSIL